MFACLLKGCFSGCFPTLPTTSSTIRELLGNVKTELQAQELLRKFDEELIAEEVQYDGEDLTLCERLVAQIHDLKLEKEALKQKQCQGKVFSAGIPDAHEEFQQCRESDVPLQQPNEFQTKTTSKGADAHYSSLCVPQIEDIATNGAELPSLLRLAATTSQTTFFAMTPRAEVAMEKTSSQSPRLRVANRVKPIGAGQITSESSAPFTPRGSAQSRSLLTSTPKKTKSSAKSGEMWPSDKSCHSSKVKVGSLEAFRRNWN
jgi:hypothetical protein